MSDISELNLNKTFDLITCCLDSTNYIVENYKIENYFKNVYNHLKKNGIFIFDINSHYKLTKILGNNIYNYDDEDVYYIWENNLEENIVDMYLTFFIKENELYKRFDEFHQERAYTKEEIQELIKESGFEILQILDDYEEKQLREDTERIVYVLTDNGGNKMSDKLVKAIAKDGQVRIIGAITTELVNEGVNYIIVVQPQLQL
ncbi:S-adenosylmethionine-dependent methyltransferase [Clostridium tetanomorphum]|nr:S-adenosylmethionine-dependent methyltransferase [Clostridium tetanomorphum]